MVFREIQAFKDRVAPGFLGRIELAFGFGQGPPLNGQLGRQAIISELLAKGDIERIVETGTNWGNTTKWFAKFGIPIDTVEISPRFWSYSNGRLAEYRHVHVEFGDSVQFLRTLSASESTKRPTLFYLDAHWPSTPLAEEITIILGAFERGVIVIDDFVVPDDPGYGFDDYGPLGALGVEYLVKNGVSGVDVFYPAMPSSEETGHRRGCAVLPIGAGMQKTLDGSPLLRKQ